MEKLASAIRAIRRETPFLITFANLGAMGLALLTAPIVARALGPDGRGETAAVLAVQAIVPILIATGVPLELRRRAALGAGEAAVRSARDLWLIGFVPSTAIAALLNASIFSQFNDTSRMIAFVGVALAPLTMSWAADVSVLIARGRYRAVMTIRLIQPVLFFVFATAFWLLGTLSVPLVIGINIAASFVSCIVGLAYVKVSVCGERMPHAVLLRSGLKFYGSSIAEAASNRLDQILVLPLVGAFGAGLYSVAVTIGSIPLALGHALGASSFRDVAAAGSPPEKSAAIAGGVKSISALAAAGCLALAAVTPFAIPFIFGEDFSEAVPLTLIMLVGSFGLTVGYVCSMMLAAQAQGVRMTVAQSVSLVVAVALLYILAPTYGAIGASIASSIAYLMLLVMLVVPLRVAPRNLLPSPSGMRTAIRTMLS